VVDRRKVIRLRQRLALGVGNRYDRGFGKDFIDAAQLRQVEPAMQVAR
jgi:hypothetical protein